MSIVGRSAPSAPTILFTRSCPSPPPSSSRFTAAPFMMLASRSNHSPKTWDPGTRAAKNMQPREKMSDANLDDAPLRPAMTSGACQPTLPVPAPLAWVEAAPTDDCDCPTCRVQRG